MQQDARGSRSQWEIKLGGEAGHKTALKTWLYDHTFAHAPDAKIASLLWALMYVVLLYLVAYLMYRKRWFIKV